MNEVTTSNPQEAVIKYYKPSELLGMFTAYLSRQDVNSQVINEELQKKLTEITKANEAAQKTHAEQLGKLQLQLKAQTEQGAKQSKDFNESLKKMQDTNGQLQKTLDKMTVQNTQTSKELNEAKDKARLLEKQLSEASSKNGSNVWMIVSIIAIIVLALVQVFK